MAHAESVLKDIKQLCKQNTYYELISTSLDELTKINKAAKLDEDDRVQSWLQWVRCCPQLKVVSTGVPTGVLHNDRQCTLHDVRVFVKYGPDDAVYDASKEIRDKIARGNCVLEVEDGSTSHLMCVVYALKKFTGGLGDDDDDRHDGNDQAWKQYFTKPPESGHSVVCLRKANGEAAHLSAVRIDGVIYLCAGSKNVHMLFRNRDDLVSYGEEQRFNVARQVCEAFLTIIEDMTPENKDRLLDFLCYSRLTGVFEMLNPRHSHVEDLSHLTRPQMVFITWMSNIIEPPHSAGLTAMPPHVAIEVARCLGLKTVDYDLIHTSELDDRMKQVRRGYGYEGEVLYFLDEENKVIGLLKKKTIWYVLCRAVREKLKTACNAQQRKPTTFSCSVFTNKIETRMGEIKSWLGLDDDTTQTWKDLGTKCLEWCVQKLERGELQLTDITDTFPVTWKRFLAEADQNDRVELRD